MSLQPNSEPSLEEILASIRRIISEDGPASAEAAAWPSGLEADNDVLVLTRPAPPRRQPVTLVETAAPPLPVAPPVLEAAPVVLDEPDEPGPSETPSAPSFKPTINAEEVPVAAQDAESQTASAFDMLEAASREAASREGDRGPSILMPSPGRTLEDVIRELMQPLIKEWLDENLPGIVQARVDEEIARIANRRGR